MVYEFSETWEPIEGFEGWYEVSNHGRVRSLNRYVRHNKGGLAIRHGKMLTIKSDKDGYKFVSIKKNGFERQEKVHRLVAKKFLPPSDLPEVNHKDFDKANNVFTNLEWASRKGNRDHATNGKRFRASKNPRMAKKLTAEIVAEIRRERQTGALLDQLASKHGVAVSTISKIASGLTWQP